MKTREILSDVKNCMAFSFATLLLLVELLSGCYLQAEFLLEA